MKIVGVIIGVAFAISAQAQYVSRLGRFQVDNIRGCAPFKVTITDANLKTLNQCTATNPCGMYYGDAPCVAPPGAACANLFTFTYNTPGTYSLKVNYQGGSINDIDDITITVDPSVQPAFEVYTCAGSQVKINITDKTYDSYTIDFNTDGSIENTIPSGNNQTVSYNYGTPGSYDISVKGKKVNAANNCAANMKSFTALAALPAPVFNTLDAVDASDLQLGLTAQPDIQYQVEFATNNATNFQIYKNLYATNTLTVPNLSVDDNYYCFRLNTHDPCANTNIASVPVCSQNFDLTLSSGRNQLDWQTGGTISGIEVQRDGADYAPLAGTATSYPDFTVTCKTKYCYVLKATYPNGAISTSLEKCGTTFVTGVPSSLDNSSAMIDGTQAQLDWKPNPLYPTSKYLILKSTDGTHYINYSNSSTPDFTDSSYDTNLATCYRVNYIDDCDNASALGQPICPIRLTGTLDAQNHIALQWSAFEGWKQGVKNYTVQKFNSSGALVATFTTTGTSLADDQDDLVNQVVTYSIIANPNELGISNSTSNSVTIVKRINLYSPTAFNPDSKHAENINFIVKGHYLSNIELQIFDRWGTMVYSSDQSEPWDGKKDGSPMPTATYVWTARGIDYSGREFKEAGTVVLIRHKN